MFNKLKTLFSKNNKFNVYVFSYFLLALLIIYTLKIPLFTYEILKNNYDKRLENKAGYCDEQGYGYTKFIRKKYKIKKNIKIINYKDQPSPEGYFADLNQPYQKKYLILIGKNKQISKYKVLNQFDDCFFVKLND